MANGGLQLHNTRTAGIDCSLSALLSQEWHLLEETVKWNPLHHLQEIFVGRVGLPEIGDGWAEWKWINWDYNSRIPSHHS